MVHRSSRSSNRMLQSDEPPAAKQPSGRKSGAAAKEKSHTPKEERLPTWMTVCIVAAVILLMFGIAAQLIMTGWLRQREEEWAAAEQRVADNHPLQYRELIEKYAAEYELQPAFVAAIILNESSYNSRA